MNGLQNLLVLKYNNYFNRKIKKLSTKADYLAFGFEYKEPVNFNSNDGVDAVQVLTLTKDQAKSDYIVILKEDSDQIDSRWFIIETTRLNGNQYRLILRRDVISDYMNEFLNSKAFIERGWIEQYLMIDSQGNKTLHADPMIYNQENLSFNKVKDAQWLLYNKNQTPYIVLYLARTDGEGKGAVYEGKFDYDNPGVVSFGINLNYSFNYKNKPESEVDLHSDPVTLDAEFEVIAIPYCDGDITYKSEKFGVTTVTQSKLLAYQWASNIASKYAESGFLYDAQLVPYIPINPETRNYSEEVDDRGRPIKEIELLLNDKSEAVQVGFKLYKSKFSLDIVNNEIKNSYDDLKKSNMLENFRITSPNGVGNFDYSPAKNEFYKTNTFEVDCTLKPISPYIKINPKFSWTAAGLYGKDFNDYRGLICSGNFSLSILKNQWLTYELNNKNYKTMFDREISTIDKVNDFSLIRDLASSFGGSIAGAGSGAVAGSLAGGTPGAIAGGLFGGSTSAGAGVIDVLLNESERELNKSLKIDLYQMSHENVKARAVGLTRSSIFNINNKIFPYVEHYNCKQEESKYFDNYINLKSYNIGVVDQPKNFTSDDKFIQGSIIDIDIQEDYHLVEAINKYFEIGFRFIGG